MANAVHFGSDFHYPDKSNPQFRVSSVKAGYHFEFFNNPDLNFTINADEVNSEHEATGYEGERAEAIEHFRSHLFR